MAGTWQQNFQASEETSDDEGKSQESSTDSEEEEEIEVEEIEEEEREEEASCINYQIRQEGWHMEAIFDIIIQQYKI